MLTRLFLLLALMLSSPALAADPSGNWAMRAGDATISRIEVKRTPRGWTGVWVRPARMSFDGDGFTEVRGPVERRIAFAARRVGDAVELRFADPRPGGAPIKFLILASDGGSAQLRFVGSDFEPISLVPANASPLGPWNPDRRYAVTIARTSNQEMKGIFAADQAARLGGGTIDWAVVSKQDEARRLRTQALLDSGALNSGDDFYHAAFVFQHGRVPMDYLKAHVLATIAAARGRADATWIAAATLDRYLMSIRQPQVFGTQFRTSPDGQTTQGEYDRSAVSDALRAAMRVPPLAEQEKQRQQMQQTMHQKMISAPKP